MKRSIPPWRCSGADCPERRIVNGGRGGVDCPHLVKARRCDRLGPHGEKAVAEVSVV